MSRFGTNKWDFRDSITEVLFALPLAILLASIMLFLRQKQFPLILLRKLGVTSFSGDSDIWDYCFSEFRVNGCFVNLRDPSNGWIIQGFTRGYSEREDLREILLNDVKVYNESGEFLFENAAMYVGRSPEQISLEFYQEQGTNDGEATP